MTNEEAMKLALEALKMADELCKGHGVDFKEYGLEFDRDIQVKYKDAITAIKEALAQLEQREPVAKLKTSDVLLRCHRCGYSDKLTMQIEHTTPPQRTWVGLTDEEIWQLVNDCVLGGDLHPDKFAKVIEARLKELNT
jgi:hypothetical protein